MSVSIFKARKQASSCSGVELKLVGEERPAGFFGGFVCGFIQVWVFFKLLEFVLF